MIKQIWICQCDICGAITKPKTIDGRYNEILYVKPDDWTTGRNEDIHICPECSKAIKRRGEI